MGPMQGAFRNRQRLDDEQAKQVRLPRPDDPPDVQCEGILDLTRQGLTVSEISRLTDIPSKSVRQMRPRALPKTKS